MNNEEFKRQQRVIDQMITMYSVLRDQFAYKAIYLTLGILGSSIILVACTFLPQKALKFLGISPFMTTVILGAFSSLVLFLSIAELRVDWKERSRQYGDAANQLADLKHKYRQAITGAIGTSDVIANNLTEDYELIFGRLPRIPDKKFLTLKAYHQRKVKLSQMIDKAVGCPVWLLRLRLFWEEDILFLVEMKKSGSPVA